MEDFFFSSRRRHTRWPRDWSSDVCSSDLRGGCPVSGHLHDGYLPDSAEANHQAVLPDYVLVIVVNIIHDILQDSELGPGPGSDRQLSSSCCGLCPGRLYVDI